MSVCASVYSVTKFRLIIFVWKGWMRGQRGCVVMDVERGRKEDCVRSGLAKIIMMEIRLGLLDPLPTCRGLVNPAPFENRPFWTLKGEERVRLPSA